MGKKLSRVHEPDMLRKTLEADLVGNSHFLWRVFHSGDSFTLHATEGYGSVMAVQTTGDHVVFAGEWDDIGIPKRLIPDGKFFVSASPPGAVEALKRHRGTAGEWPCWFFLAPDGYGPGEWDALGPLHDEDVRFIAPFWELGGDDREEHIRESVKRFDSACLRVGGKPISWCGLHFELGGIGNLGFAHTLQEHRRMGHQATVTKALVNKLHARGVRATSDVIKDNSASIATCKSLGFEVVGEQSWTDFEGP